MDPTDLSANTPSMHDDINSTDHTAQLTAADTPRLVDTRDLEVIFIRHAETQENVRINSLFAILTGLMQFRLPSFDQLSQVTHLVLLKEEDSDLSPRGAQQLLDMQKTLQVTQFWEKNPFDVCFYSPYIRAERTCKVMLPPNLHDQCKPLAFLKEIPFYAHLSSTLRQKTIHLENFLLNPATPLAYTHRRVILVGHCKFFHTLLNPPGDQSGGHPSELMWNCDIVRATMRVTSTSTSNQVSWSKPELVLRSPLSIAHPASALLKYRIFQGGSVDSTQPAQDTPNNESAEGKEEQEQEDEPICRICHGPSTPSTPLFSPCKCKGSVRYVHIHCLNMWRAHSNNNSGHACSICGYVYRVRQTWWGKVFGALGASSSVEEDLVGFVVRCLIVTISLLSVSLLLGRGIRYVLVDRHVGAGSFDLMLDISNWGDYNEHRRRRGGICTYFPRPTPRLPPRLTLPLVYTHMLYPIGLSWYCNPFWNRGIGDLLAGALGLGWVAQVASWGVFIWQLVRGGGGAQGWGAVGLTFVWFGGTDLVASLRVWAALGLMYVGRKIYEGIISGARAVAAAYCPDEIANVDDE